MLKESQKHSLTRPC